MKKRIIKIDRLGTAHFIDDDQLSDEMQRELGGKVSRRRASNIEPVNPIARAAFYAIRRRVDDSHWLAAWTRSWRVLWRVNLSLSGGPTFGGFERRADALAAEVDWLLCNRF